MFTTRLKHANQIAQKSEPYLKILTVLFLLVSILALAGCTVRPIVGQEPEPTIIVTEMPVPVIAVAPDAVRSGDTVNVSGAGWQPEEIVTVVFQRSQDGEQTEVIGSSFATGIDGRFSISLAYPFGEVWRDVENVQIVAYSPESGARSTAALRAAPAIVEATPALLEPADQAVASPVDTPALTQETNIVHVTSTGLNLRSGPGTNYAINRTLSQGTEMTVLGQNSDGAWLLVRLSDGSEGWVSSAYTDSQVFAPLIASFPLIVDIPTTVPPTPTNTPSIVGWRGEYYANRDLAGLPVVVRDDSSVDFDWEYGAPLSGLSADNFSVRWQRSTFFEESNYNFYALSDDGIRAWVDDVLVIDQWHDTSLQTYVTSRYLQRGFHTVRIEYFEHGGFASARFWWERVSDFPDWRGEYYDNESLSGSPRFTRNDPNLDFDWNDGSPGGGLSSDHFSVRWTRNQHFESDHYRFHVHVDDGMRLYVDNDLIIDTWHDGSERERTAERWLSRGTHILRVEYYEDVGDTRAKVWWERTSDTTVDIDTEFPEWKARYYSNRDLDGDPRLRRNDRVIDFNWGTGRPDSRLPRDDFSVKWTREYDFSPGTYRFYARADDGIRAWIDNDRIIDEWHASAGGQLYTIDRYMDGRYDLEVEYYERSGGARAEFWWDRIDDTPTPTSTPTHTSTPTATSTPTSTPSRPPDIVPYADVVHGSGPVGLETTITGGGFPANTKVNLHIGTVAAASVAEPHTFASTATDRFGNFSMSFTVPTTWPGGTPVGTGQIILVIATDNFGFQASTALNVVEPQPTVALNPHLNASPSSGGAGTQVTVNGGGFPAGAQVNIHLAQLVRASSVASAPESYADTTVDTHGNFSAQFTMPATWPDGSAIGTGKLAIVAATADFATQATAMFDYFVEAYNPSIQVGPSTGAPNMSATASGGGFPANRRVNLHLGAFDRELGGQSTHEYGWATADENGDYAIAFTLPPVWPDGSPITTDKLMVLVATNDFSVQISTVINFEPAQPSPTPTITPTPQAAEPGPTPTWTPVAGANISPATGGANTQVTLSGAGFPANAKVNVHLGRFGGGGSVSDLLRYATATTDNNGNYRADFVMPATFPSGDPIPTGKLLIVVATENFSLQTSTLFDYVQNEAQQRNRVEPASVGPQGAPSTSTPAPPPAVPEPPPTPPRMMEPTPTWTSSAPDRRAAPVNTPVPPTVPPTATWTPQPASDESGPAPTPPRMMEPTPTWTPLSRSNSDCCPPPNGVVAVARDATQASDDLFAIQVRWTR